MADDDVLTSEAPGTPAEHLGQLDPAETLIDRGVADPLDEGYTTAERWSPLMAFGATPAEMRAGEAFAARLAQEESEPPDAGEEDWRAGEHHRQVGGRRAGRLVARGGLADGEAVGEDVGIDGGAASAEEAAMHIIEDEDES